MYIEDQIIALRKQEMEKPFGWLVCFEGRPLQGIPPKGNGPHIMFFSEEKKAQAFIADRQSSFGVEPLSSLQVDTPDSLKLLALNPSTDTRYVAPPCGIVYDFHYPSGKASKLLPAADVQRMLAAEIAAVFGLRTNQVIASVRAEPLPVATGQPKAVSQKRPLRTALIACGSLLLLGLLVLCIGGIWYGLKIGVIPAPEFLRSPTPTFTPSPTMTPSPTFTPTATITPTPTQVTFDLNVVDDFSTNTNNWPLYDGNPPGECGSDSLQMQDNSLIWTINGAGSCNWWNYPDLPAVTNFNLAIDVQRSGTSGNAAGLIFRIVDSGYQSYYIFLVDDINHTYHIARNNRGDWKTLADWNYSGAIKPGEFNRIEVSARGPQFTFFINGTKVTSINDTAISIGKVGILASVYNNGDLDTVIFKNFEFHAVKR